MDRNIIVKQETIPTFDTNTVAVKYIEYYPSGDIYEEDHITPERIETILREIPKGISIYLYLDPNGECDFMEVLSDGEWLSIGCSFDREGEFQNYYTYNADYESTSEEIEMVRAAKNINSRITAETSINYLWFSDSDYERLGSRIKCNPSVKTAADRDALREALKNGLIDTVGTDHAPHLESEKDRPYMSAPSGIPSVQQSLPVLLTVASQEDIPLSRIAAVFSEKAAEMFGIRNRGFIKEGYYADIVIADPEAVYTVRKDDLKYKCGWCPYEGVQMKGKIDTVFVNGHKAVRNDGTIQDPPSGKKLFFK